MLYIVLTILITFVISVLISIRRKTTKDNHKTKNTSNSNTYTYKKTMHKKHLIDVTNFLEVKVQRVIDGDTVVVIHSFEKIKIRLDSIDCPENNQEWGDIATHGLIKLIGGKKIRIEKHTIDCYERTVATIYVQCQTTSQWINVNERMVTLGHAWVMRRYYKHLPRIRQNKLNSLERWAKSKKVGLWRSNSPIPPWIWRRQEKK